MSAPWGIRIISFSMLLFFLSRTLNLILNREKVIKWNLKLLLPLVLYFFVILISSSLSFTSFDLSIKHLETRVSLLLLPILLYGFYVEKNFISRCLKYYVFSITVYCIVCLVIATKKSFSFEEEKLVFDSVVRHNGTWSLDFIGSIKRNTNYYFGNYYSLLTHTTYAALFINTAKIILLSSGFRIKRYLSILFIVFFEINLMLIQSKAGLLCSLIIYLFFIYRQYSSIQIWKKILILLIAIVSFLFVIKLSPRFEQIRNIISPTGNSYKTDIYTANERVYIWKASFDLIKENPVWGIGSGNIQQNLLDKYNEYDFERGILEKYNCHNQYLQNYLIAGIFGLVSLVFILYSIFHFYKKTGVFWILVFLINFAVFLVFESMLERLWGIHYLVSFYAVFYLRSKSELGNV